MSRLTTVDAVAVPPDDVAVHVNVVAAVSVVTVAASQPVRDETGESGSWTSQLTETSETYQPSAAERAAHASAGSPAA